MKTHFNCNKCPAYCCSYDLIPTTDADIRRLAKHFGISNDQARRRFTRSDKDSDSRVLRHVEDEHFGTVCRFLDQDTRQCSIYKVRPRICRDFPGRPRCGYYEFLKFERRAQDDPDWIATTR